MGKSSKELNWPSGSCQNPIKEVTVAEWQQVSNKMTEAGKTDFNEMYLWETDLGQMCSELAATTLISILLAAPLQLPVCWWPGVCKCGKEEGKGEVCMGICEAGAGLSRLSFPIPKVCLPSNPSAVCPAYQLVSVIFGTFVNAVTWQIFYAYPYFGIQHF